MSAQGYDPSATSQGSTGNTETGRHRGVDELRESATALKQDVRQMGSAVKHVAEDGVRQAKDMAGKAYEKGRESVSEWQGSVEGYVRQRPLRSILMAAGAGVVLGFLLRPRRG